jgi:hypothetical protein
VTSGTDTGVMALVGEAVRDHGMTAGAEDSNVVCIGFATWGAIKDRDKLEQNNIEVFNFMDKASLSYHLKFSLRFTLSCTI